MTLEEIAAALDLIALDMAFRLMPPAAQADDKGKALYIYALGLASAAVRQRAEQLRKFAGVAEG